MNQRSASMIVTGAGSYGTALAITLARDSHEVVLWGYDPERIVTLERDCCNAAFLPDVPFLDTLHLESDLVTALVASRNILVAVPSHVFGEALRQIKPLTCPDVRLVWATKGLETETRRLLQDVACEALGDQVPLVVISGPTLAKELAAGLPTAISLASTNQTLVDDFQQLLYCGKSLRVHGNPDLISVQLGGAMKNVIAIGAGTSDDIGFGTNARAALITHGLVEVSRLGAALGADLAIFTDVAGLGDPVLTCTDNQSCNHCFDMTLGQDMDAQSVQEEIGQVAEGYRNTKEVRELAHRFGIETLITKEIYQVSYCGKSACEAALILLGRARKDERSSHQSQGTFVTAMTRSAQNGPIIISSYGVSNVV